MDTTSAIAVTQYSEKTNLIKWLAILTMTIDHIGYFLYPDIPLLRIIGRIAFPCFLYTTVLGVERTHDFNQYLIRLFGFALLSYPVTAYVGYPWNILFSLSIFATSVKYPYLFLPAVYLSQYTEYGVYGFLLGWSIYVIVKGNKWLGAQLFLFLQWYMMGADLQSFSSLALLFILLPEEWSFKFIRMPKYLAYFYYPVHQLILIWLQFNFYS